MSELRAFVASIFTFIDIGTSPCIRTATNLIVTDVDPSGYTSTYVGTSFIYAIRIFIAFMCFLKLINPLNDVLYKAIS